MTIENQQDLIGMQRVGRIVGETLREMQHQARPGMTTAALDTVAQEHLAKHGARSAPQLLYDFPATACISVNDEAVHGIPGPRILRPGDVVTFDVTAEKDGYIADAAITIVLSPITPMKRRLRDCARAAFDKALEVAKAGQPVNVIGKAIESEVQRQGFTVMVELSSHGVGRAIHEAPTVPNFYVPTATTPLTEGMVITIEPIIGAGSCWSKEQKDGWTISTADGSLSAHHEHTIMITKDTPVILTEI